MEDFKKNYWAWAHKLGIFFIIFFVACFVWYYIHPVNPELQLQALQIQFFGFSGMNFPSFILAAIQSYIWGYLVAILWMLACGCSNKCKK
jgi:hypothetical protein